jgi:4-amino-4-deoxy-L-arabinose transferase-like glycosyltransferase
MLYIPTMLNRDLHYRDELRYAEVAKEMSVKDNWLVPHLGGEIYPDKPPLYFWILNFSRTVFGEYSTKSMVIPSMLSALIIVLLTFYFGRSFLEDKYALLGSLILASSFLFYSLAIFVRMDLFMMTFITAAIFSFYKAYFQKKDKFYYLFYIFMSAAVAVKGPAGFIIPLSAAIGFLIWEGNLSEFKNIKPLKGLALFIGIILLWLVPALISGGKEYAYQLLIVQTFGRTVDSFAHAEPFYYYLITFPVTFFPWSLVLFSSFIYMIRRKNIISTEFKFLTSWFVFPIVLFSFFSGKLVFYLLPIYPAASLIIAQTVQKINENNDIKYINYPVIITFLALSAAAIFSPDLVVEGYNLITRLLPTIISTFLLTIGAIYFAVKKKEMTVIYLLVILMLIFSINLSSNIIPTASREYTKRPISEKIREFKLKKGVENITAFQYGQPETLAVYTGFIIDDIATEKELLDYIKEKEEALVLLSIDKWNKLKYQPVFRETKTIYYSNDYALIYYNNN